MAIIVNFIAFQIGWFACVLGAANHMPLMGTGIALTIIVLHLAYATDPLAELKLILAAAGFGVVLDPTLVLTGLIVFASGTLFDGTVAHWMVALWMLFAITLNVSLRWVKERPLLAVVLGGIGGPLAYLAGAKLGALQVDSNLGIVAIGVGWSIAMWLLVILARRFNGFAPAVVVSHES
jgi:Protein of unknown function (DUF2878)